MGRGLRSPSAKVPPALTLLGTVKMTLNLQASFGYKGRETKLRMETDQVLITSFEALDSAMPRARPASSTFWFCKLINSLFCIIQTKLDFFSLSQPQVLTNSMGKDQLIKAN